MQFSAVKGRSEQSSEGEGVVADLLVSKQAGSPVHCTLYYLQCIVYSVQFKLYTVIFTVHYVQGTVFTVHCTI